MGEKKRAARKADAIEFVPVEAARVSSAAVTVAPADTGIKEAPVQATSPESEPARSPAFKVLAEPELPPLERENRARLLMQTPNRIFFYWSTGSNPFQILDRALAGQSGNYTLVLKLTDLKRGSDETIPVESAGTRWFNVEADREYQAEIGLHSPSRPYIRILYSNIVQTPRKAPSPRAAETGEWRISADSFSEVLHVAGFQNDAFDVAIAGDDAATSEAATHAAFSDFLGTADAPLDGIAPEELRYALLALASGMTLESLRWKIGARLFALVQEHEATLSAERALATLQERFNVEPAGFLEEDLSAVHGSSPVSFPRRLRYRPLRELESVSSHTSGAR